LPVIGDAGGSTVVQQMKVAVWAPDDVVFVGDPDLWTQEGSAPPSISNPLRSGSATVSATNMSKWVDPQGIATGDFPTQGSVAVFRAVGRQASITVDWWSRPFLFGMISGTLLIVGLILRRTSWENRITVVLLALFAVSVWSLQGDNASQQYLSMAWPGVLVVGGIWLTGLLIGARNGAEENGTATPVSAPVPLASPPAPVAADAASTTTVSENNGSSGNQGGEQ
jgi:hypothetical protein